MFAETLKICIIFYWGFLAYNLYKVNSFHTINLQ